MVSTDTRSPGPCPAIAARIAFPAFWAIVFALQSYNRDFGLVRAAILVAAMVLAAFLMRRSARGSASEARSLPPLAATLVLGLLVLFAVAQTAYVVLRLRHPHLLDIALTTIEAARLMVEGANPYTSPVDGEAASQLGQIYGGFKYLPVMAAAYIPLGVPFGERGVLLTNLLLQAATAGLVGALASGEDKRYGAGLLAAAIYLSLPMVPFQVFTKGATDLLPVVPLLGALLLADRHPLLSGLLAGLSVSSKLLPGVAVLPACVPGRRGSRLPFIAGLALGLVPSAAYLVLAPSPFLANIVAFNLVRAPDATSWFPSAGPWLAHGVQLLVAAFWLATLAAAWRAPLAPERRCALAALLTMASILAGGISHQNYHLWWLPFMSVVVGRAMIGVVADRPAGRQGG